MDHEDTNNEPTIFMGDGCDRVVSPELIYASEAPRSMTIWGEVEVGGGSWWKQRMWRWRLMSHMHAGKPKKRINNNTPRLEMITTVNPINLSIIKVLAMSIKQAHHMMPKSEPLHMKICKSCSAI